MNAFPVVKSFTAVLIFLVSISVWGEDKTKPESKDACITRVNQYTCPVDDKYTTCSQIQTKKIETECGEKLPVKEKDANCNIAYKEWSALAGDGSNACEAFDPDIGKTCGEKIENCRSKINGAFEQPSEEPDQSGMEMLSAMVQKKLAGDASQTGGSNACVSQYDSTKALAAKKDLDQKKKDLERDIKKELDDQLKSTEEQRKKANEIAKKITTLQKDLKKFNLEKDTEMRKQIGDAAKVTLDSAKKIRGLNLAITSKNNALAQLRFKHQTEMLDLVDERVTFSCKQQLLSVKNGILSNSSEDEKSPNYSEKKALADQFRNKGTKGTAELKALLTLTHKKCFETANTKKNQTVMQFTQAQTDLENDIREIKSQIDDENKQLALSQDNIKKIQGETDTAKTEEEKAMLAEKENLDKELADSDKSISEKIALSKAQAAKLNMDIQNLALQTNLDIKMAFSDASKAIDKAEDARVAAVKQCCTGDSRDNRCPRLDKSALTPSKKSGSSNPKAAK